MKDISHKIAAVRTRIADAARSAGRDPASVRLLAVTKSQPVAAVLAAYSAGIHDFGANYLQEAILQMDAVPGAEWHYIGRLQSNKTRAVAERFAWVHTVERLDQAVRLSRQRPPGLPPLNLCIQVNIDDEPRKGGVAPGATALLAREIAGLQGVRLRGLMAIPRASDDPRVQRDAFARVAAVLEGLRASGLDLDTLSMGMSADLEAAVHEGATLVRIGTALFGPRS